MYSENSSQNPEKTLTESEKKLTAAREALEFDAKESLSDVHGEFDQAKKLFSGAEILAKELKFEDREVLEAFNDPEIVKMLKKSANNMKITINTFDNFVKDKILKNNNISHPREINANLSRLFHATMNTIAKIRGEMINAVKMSVLKQKRKTELDLMVDGLVSEAIINSSYNGDPKEIKALFLKELTYKGLVADIQNAKDLSLLEDPNGIIKDENINGMKGILKALVDFENRPKVDEIVIRQNEDNINIGFIGKDFENKKLDIYSPIFHVDFNVTPGSADFNRTKDDIIRSYVAGVVFQLSFLKDFKINQKQEDLLNTHLAEVVSQGMDAKIKQKLSDVTITGKASFYEGGKGGFKHAKELAEKRALNARKEFGKQYGLNDQASINKVKVESNVYGFKGDIIKDEEDFNDQLELFAIDYEANDLIKDKPANINTDLMKEKIKQYFDGETTDEEEKDLFGSSIQGYQGVTFNIKENSPLLFKFSASTNPPEVSADASANGQMA